MGELPVWVESLAPGLMEPQSDAEPSLCSQSLQSDGRDEWHGRKAETVTKQRAPQYLKTAEFTRRNWERVD